MAVDARKSSRVTPEPKSGQGKRPKAPAGGRSAKRPSIFKDSRVRLMGFAAVGLVIFYLVVIISSILMGVLASDQPATMAERDLDLYSAMIDAGAIDEKVWAGYALALTDLGQYDRAQEVLDDATKAEIGDNQVRALYSVQANLYREQGELDKAIESARAGMTMLEEQLATDQKAMINGAGPTSLTANGLPDSYWEMTVIIGQVYEEQGKDEDALEIVSYHALNNPDAADILEWRGDILARLGRNEEAVVDWTSALKFLGEQDDIDRVQSKIDGGE